MLENQPSSIGSNAKNAIEPIVLEAASEKHGEEYPANKPLEVTLSFLRLLERREIEGNAGVGSVGQNSR